MTTDDTLPRGSFYQHSRAYYAARVPLDRGVVDDVIISLPDSGEWLMKWFDLGDGKISPRLDIFNDGWAALIRYPDLIAALVERDDQDITPADFCALLERLGFVDLTPTTRPGQR